MTFIDFLKANEDKIPGGKADSLSLEDIAAIHNVAIAVLLKEFEIGVKEEMEHTSDPKVAKEIALDHLSEDPNYYTKLKNAGLEELALDEFNISSIYDRVKQYMTKKPEDDVNIQSIRRDTQDDLTAAHRNTRHTTVSAADDLDDNIADQDPHWHGKVEDYLKSVMKDNNYTDEQIAKVISAYNKAPEKVSKMVLNKFGRSLQDIRTQLATHDETPDDIHNRNMGKVMDYIHGHTDELWEEAAEEFDEVEVLDERKFEKVKMARNMLSKLGYPKAYERNDKGKYILRSKHIKQLMRKLNYVFSDEKARWIPAPEVDAPKNDADPVASIDAPSPEIDAGSPEEQPEKKAIIWVGRAQPWHRGQDSIIQQGMAQLKSVGANMVFIILVKEDEEHPDPSHPLSFEQEIKLLGSVYENEKTIDISSVPTNTSSIVDILVTAAKQGVTVKGWIAGSKHIEGYKKQFESFKTHKYKNEFEQKTSPGTPYPIEGDITFIPVTSSKEMTGAKARESANRLAFHYWFVEVCPEKYNTSESAKEGYREVYAILTGKVMETYLEKRLRPNIEQVFFGG